MAYTIGCSFRCAYCHNPELVDITVTVTYTEEDVLAFLSKRKGILDGLVITGGEPTIHAGLPAFIAKVKKLGFLVKLDSNGTNPTMLKSLIDDGLIDYVAMDVKSPMSHYSATVARPVDTEAIRASIQILLASNINYEFRTTIIKSMQSPEDLLEIAQEIKGAKNYYLQKFIPTKLLNPQFRRKVTYTDEEFEEFREKISHYVTNCGIR
jgi:pyruvate formate lyase activating enzyme